jgi:hypothetical protein
MRRRCPHCRRMHLEDQYAHHVQSCGGLQWGEPCKCGARKAPGADCCYRCEEREPELRELDLLCAQLAPEHSKYRGFSAS